MEEPVNLYSNMHLNPLKVSRKLKSKSQQKTRVTNPTKTTLEMAKITFTSYLTNPDIENLHNL